MEPTEKLAQTLLFYGAQSLRATLAEHGLEYRKGKNADDVRKALQKGYRAGNGRTENEISMVALYLKSVLKKVKAAQGSA
jgi:hypothetical protein